MAFKYPLTMKAAQKDQRNQWDLGDALLKECDPPGKAGAHNGSEAKLEEAQKELDENGLHYDLDTLRRYRQISHNFPPENRFPGHSHKIHLLCFNQKTMKKVIALWRHENGQDAILPQHACSRLLKTIRAEEEMIRQREERTAHEAAQRAEKAARAKLEAAREKARKATAGSARTAANAQVTLAQRAVERAQGRVEETAELPPHKPRTAPIIERPTAMVFITDLMSKVSKAGALADEVLDIVGAADQHMLTEDTLAGLLGDALIAQEKWTKVREVFHAISEGRRPHLMIVAGE